MLFISLSVEELNQTPEASPELTKRSWFGSLMSTDRDETYTIIVKGKPLASIKADLVQAFLSVSIPSFHQRALIEVWNVDFERIFYIWNTVTDYLPFLLQVLKRHYGFTYTRKGKLFSTNWIYLLQMLQPLLALAWPNSFIVFLKNTTRQNLEIFVVIEIAFYSTNSTNWMQFYIKF